MGCNCKGSRKTTEAERTKLAEERRARREKLLAERQAYKQKKQ